MVENILGIYIWVYLSLHNKLPQNVVAYLGNVLSSHSFCGARTEHSLAGGTWLRVFHSLQSECWPERCTTGKVNWGGEISFQPHSQAVCGPQKVHFQAYSQGCCRLQFLEGRWTKNLRQAVGWTDQFLATRASPQGSSTWELASLRARKLESEKM